MIKYLVGAGVVLILMGFGAAIGTYVLSGLILFATIVAITETIAPIRWLMVRLVNLFDLILFGVGVYTLFASGVTVAFAIGVAGILFTVYYKPFLINREIKKAKARR